METIDDAGLQAYFERTRGVAGIRLVGLREARRELTDALRNGIPVGLVGDRDLTGGGTPIPLFGAPALMPMGPAMLAVETRRPDLRDDRPTRRRRPVPRQDRPDRGPRRGDAPRTRDDHDDPPRRRLRGAHRRCARPVVGGLLPDLARPRGRGDGRRGRGHAGAEAGRRRAAPERPAPDDATREPRGPRHDRRPERLGRADLHIHTLASDGTAGIEAILDHVERLTDLDVIAITDHERIDAAVAAQAIARDRGLRADVVVGEEVTTLGGHLLALYLDRPIRPYRSLRTTILAVHEAGGLAIPAHPLVPYPLCAQGWVLRRLLDDPDPAAHPDAPRDVQPDQPRQAVAPPGRPLRRRPRPGPCRQQRRPRARGHRPGLDDVPGPRRHRPAPGDRDPRRPSTAARSTRRPASSARSATSCASVAATRATRSPAGSGATARVATTAIRAAASGHPATRRTPSSGERR